MDQTPNRLQFKGSRAPAWSAAGSRALRKIVRAATISPIAIGAIVLATVAGPVVLAPSAGASSQRQVIEVFGDSLGWQAGSYLARDFRKTTIVNESHLYPGTSVCDWLPAIEKLTTSDAPNVAVLEFIGNVSTCDGSVTSPTALASAYKADLTKAITTLLGVGVRYVIVDEGPRAHCTLYAYCVAQPNLHAAFVQVVTSFNSSYVIYAGLADRAVETPDGKFAQSLKCLAAESRAKFCARGAQIIVRSADGVHFCPVSDQAQGKMTPCPIYASGAYRFAAGLAKTIWALDPSTKPTTGTTTP